MTQQKDGRYSMETEIEQIANKLDEKQGHCWFGMHKYSAWSLPSKVAVEGLAALIGMTLDRQQRYCLKCKKIDYRYPSYAS